MDNNIFNVEFQFRTISEWIKNELGFLPYTNDHKLRYVETKHQPLIDMFRNPVLYDDVACFERLVFRYAKVNKINADDGLIMNFLSFIAKRRQSFIDSSIDELYEKIRTKVFDKHLWYPYTFSEDNHHETTYVESKFAFLRDFYPDRALIDDEECYKELQAQTKKTNDSVTFSSILTPFFQRIQIKRTNFINDVKTFRTKRLKAMKTIQQRVLKEPKRRKDDLRKLFRKSFDQKYWLTDDEFERWFNDVYSKKKKDERIEDKKEPKPQTFNEMLNELVQTSTKILTFTEFREAIRNFPKTTKDINENYSTYVDMMNERKHISRPIDKSTLPIPFKTKRKVDALARAGLEENKRKVLINSFPTKQNEKTYGFRTVAPHGMFIIDLMFGRETTYLIAIEVNTRKLYAQPTNVIVDGDFFSSSKNSKNTEQYLQALQEIINQGAEIKALKGDGESAFTSKKSLRFYKNHGITFIPVDRLILANGSTDPSHTSLALIDRAIRTIRDMAYNVGKQLEPSIVHQLVMIYNQTPHSTLSKLMGFDVSPDLASSDPELETEIARRLAANNYQITLRPLFVLPYGTRVYVYENYDKMSKRRTIIKPDPYKVIDFDRKRNKYVVVNELNEDEKLVVSRTKIKPENELLLVPKANL